MKRHRSEKGSGRSRQPRVGHSKARSDRHTGPHYHLGSQSRYEVHRVGAGPVPSLPGDDSEVAGRQPLYRAKACQGGPTKEALEGGGGPQPFTVIVP